jgi:hydrogenase nickel incorporation protein HypA/HybF
MGNDMHELSICQALLDEVAQLARSHAADSVEEIVIEVGALSGVDPALLSRAFSIARAGTCAACATLYIEPIAVTVLCVACGTRSEVPANRLVCTTCHDFRTRVVEGDELRLRRVALRPTAMHAAQAS